VNEFISYLASHRDKSPRIPSLIELAQKLGVSVGKLREQMEVARSLGFVEVHPRTGIWALPYSFFPAVDESLQYAIACDRNAFHQFGELRIRVEAAFFAEAAGALKDTEFVRLRELIANARQKLSARPALIPHDEHRGLHLTIFSKLNNPFVTGVLEAYWSAYEAQGLSLYADFHYLQQVWDFHDQMVEAIIRGQLGEAEDAFTKHTKLLRHREGRGGGKAEPLYVSSHA
jgi:DNA-binding FadR family transcriptional regulator